MLNRSRRRRRGEQGQTLILALAFIALFGLVTAAVLGYADSIFLQHVHTEATAASDATTQGGAAFAVANTEAGSGCTVGATGTLTMQSGGTVGYAITGCDPSGTQSIVDRSAPEQCLLCLLGTGASASLNIQEYTTLTAAGPAAVDGNGSNAGSVTSTAPASGYIGYSGTWNVPPPNTGAGTASPSPTKMSTTVADPLASLPIPSPTNGVCSPASDQTLTPGDVYCSVSWDNHASRANLTLSPGTYYILGGMSLSGDVEVTGTGVLLYFGCSSGSGRSEALTPCTSRNDAGGYLSVADGSTFDITAPTSGSWAGISVVFDRLDIGSSTACGSAGVCVIGSAAIGGTVYGAAAPVDIEGPDTDTISGQLVASTLELFNNGCVPSRSNPCIPSGPTLKLTGSAITAGYCSIAEAEVGGGSSTNITYSGQVVFQDDCPATGGSGVIGFNYSP